ncbi:MAG: transaldolase family protein [Candidatus Pacearchaeota archaeon]
MQKRRVLFIDSAIPEEVEQALREGFQGVTTNPTLVSKAPKGDSSKPFIDRYIDHIKILSDICRKYICNDGKFPSLSVEVFSLEPSEMIEQAKIIRDKLKYPELAIKIPVSYKDKNYLEVIRILSRQGFKVNATCAFSESQLQLSAQAGARFVSLFYNRLIDYFNELENSDGKGMEKSLEILSNTRKFLDNNPNYECEIILGSIRKSFDVTNGWKYGADIVTAGYKIIQGLMKHKGTDTSVEGFEKDLKEWMK